MFRSKPADKMASAAALLCAVSLLGACAGGHAINLAAISAALVTAPVSKAAIAHLAKVAAAEHVSEGIRINTILPGIFDTPLLAALPLALIGAGIVGLAIERAFFARMVGESSFSMVMENRWLPMKRTALALNHLVSTRFRSDALQIIAFGRYARTVTAAELTGLEGVYEQGTNLHHALALAVRHLRRHPNAQPVVLVVTELTLAETLKPDRKSVV